MEEKPRILLVDDNTTNIFSLQKILERMPVEIDTALSGRDAIVLANNHYYSLALVDIQMPEMDGFETLSQIRLTKNHEHIPVILISAIFTEDQYRIKGMQTGAVDFIPKPVSPEIIRAKVKVFLDLEDQRHQLDMYVGELTKKNKLLSREIRKRKKIEGELREARAKAEKTSELKSQLLVNMSHEIRTPVNSILGFADMITNPSVPNPDKERYLRYVSHSSQNLLFLIDEILEHSRLEAGELKITSSPCQLNELMNELDEAFQKIKDQTKDKGLELIHEKPTSTDSVTIMTDGQRLRQVISNLLNNAVKYTKKGSIHFGYTLGDKKIEFYVKDTGIGIPKKELDTVFTRFKRVEEQSDLKAKGTGLGLSLSKNIVELLGGKIWVSSELGIGSDFRFEIPLEQVTFGDPAEEEHGFDEVIDWSQKTLLIAEDEEMNYLFLQEALKETGISILWAQNGQEAVDQVKGHDNIDAVLMDVKMPDMDGYEATSQVKSFKPELPVIIQTAFAITEDNQSNQPFDFDDYITKPINRKILIKTLLKYL